MNGTHLSEIEQQIVDAIEGEKGLNRIREILEAGDDVNVRNQDGDTPLTAAVIGSINIVNLLIAKGADINQLDECLNLLIPAQKLVEQTEKI